METTVRKGRDAMAAWMLATMSAMPLGVRGDARYFRDGGREQIFYTRSGIIYRYPEGDPLYRVGKDRIRRCGNDRLIYRLENDAVIRVSDGRRLYLVRDDRVIRCADGKTLYRFDGEFVRRVSDDRAVLRRQGEDPRLTVFMVLMLADM